MNRSSLNKQTEALKLALKALEKQVSMAGGWQTPAEATAITAIREALAEQPAQQEKEGALLRALEIIAVGDAKNSHAQAAEVLISLGYWRDIPEVRALAEQPAQQELVQSAPQQAQETGWQALSAGPIKVLHQCRAALIGPVADGLARRCAVAAIDAELARPVQQEYVEHTSVRRFGPQM